MLKIKFLDGPESPAMRFPEESLHVIIRGQLYYRLYGVSRKHLLPASLARYALSLKTLRLKEN